MRIERETESEDQTMALAADLAGRLRPGDLVALNGALGAGKTCFVRGMARGLGIDPRNVSSPTFVLCQEYSDGSGITLVHIDAYRMSGADDLESIGWEELLTRRDAIIAVEWPERLGDAMPMRRIDVELDHLEPNRRRIVITAPDVAEVSSSNDLPPCRVCGESLKTDAYSPFCSERCRLVDLGRWFSGSYRISRFPGADDAELD